VENQRKTCFPVWIWNGLRLGFAATSPLIRIFHKNIPRRGLRGMIVPDILNKSPNAAVSGETVETRHKKIVKVLATVERSLIS
jgi:hypothetical protein